jgi:hypothetical protein
MLSILKMLVKTRRLRKMYRKVRKMCHNKISYEYKENSAQRRNKIGVI